MSVSPNVKPLSPSLVEYAEKKISECDMSLSVITKALDLVNRKTGLAVMNDVNPDMVEDFIISELTYRNMFIHFAMSYPGFRRLLMPYFITAYFEVEI